MQEMRQRHHTQQRVVQPVIITRVTATTIRTAVSLEHSVGMATAFHNQQHCHHQQQQLRDV